VRAAEHRPADTGSDAGGPHRLLPVARHIAWRCDCGVGTYGAPLVDDAAC